MSTEFRKPVFGARTLEFRYENGKVYIYGTREGLSKLSELILRLIARKKDGHTHLEDYELLTTESLIGEIDVVRSIAER